jgi:hypothetical protein
MFKLRINIKKIANGVDIPKEVEGGLYFYELVVTEKDYLHPITRIPFHPDVDDDITLELWESNIEIPPHGAIGGSMGGTVVRFNEYPLEFHFYKVMGDESEELYDERLERIGYKRHIQEGTSSTQDVASFSIRGGKDKPPRSINYIMEFTREPSDRFNYLKIIDEAVLDRNEWGSPKWLTQRNFYGSTGVTVSNFVHRENLEVAIKHFLQRYKTKTFNTICDMLVEFGKVMRVGRIRYESDKAFAESGVPTDAGDALVEITTKGDCEDFGHFYMRNIRMLCRIYKYLLDDTCDLYYKCKTVADEYVAFNYICRVQLSHGLEFHSTMLLVPFTNANPVISFEVTDTDKSYTLPSKEFEKWHTDSYFILEQICIHRLNRKGGPREQNSVPIEDLTISNLFLYNY